MNTRIALRVVVALLAAAAPLSAQSRMWREDERTTITSFHDVNAIAYDGRRVFAASPYGLEIYDVLSRKWLNPSTREDGYPVYDRPVFMTYDRSYGGLWLVTQTRATWLWSDLSGRWELRAFVNADSLIALGAQQRRSIESDAAWRIMRGSSTVDAQGRRWPVSAVTPADRAGTYWVGTSGGNIMLADARSMGTQWFTYGTLARGTSALAVGTDGTVWFGGNGAGPRDGIARADSALQNFVWYDAATTRAPRRLITRMLADSMIWAASSDGLYVLQPKAQSWQRVDESGLGSKDVRALALATQGVWVGTTNGFALYNRGNLHWSWEGEDWGPVNDMAVRGDTLWMASNKGLWNMVPAGELFDLLRAPGADSIPELRDAIRSVAATATRIFALTSAGRVLSLDGTTSEVVSNATISSVARVTALRGDPANLFVIGERGVARWQQTTNAWSYISIPGDIPDAPVMDVVAQGAFVWLATPGGAVRVRWP